MYDGQSLSHTKWECKHHIVWIPKYRKKAIFEDLRKYLGEIFRDLAKQKECKVVRVKSAFDPVRPRPQNDGYRPHSFWFDYDR